MTDNPSDSLGRQIKGTTPLPSPSPCMPSSWNTFTCLERTLSPFSARLSVCLFRSWVACADVHCEAGASPGGKAQSQEIKMEACVPPGLQSFDMKNLGGAPYRNTSYSGSSTGQLCYSPFRELLWKGEENREFLSNHLLVKIGTKIQIHFLRRAEKHSGGHSLKTY